MSSQLISTILWLSLISATSFDLNGMKNKAACKSKQCSSGFVAVPKRSLKLISGGCSALTNSMSMGGSFGTSGAEMLLETCCDVYQACYSICGMRKKTCETDFLSCMDTTCSNQKSSASIDRCKKDMGLYKVLLQIGDCSKYDTIQSSNCKCVAEDKANDKRILLLNDFWKKHSKKKKTKQEAAKLTKKYSTTKKFAKLLLKLVKKYPKAVSIQRNKQNQVMEELIKRSQRDQPREERPPHETAETPPETTSTVSENDGNEDKEDDEDTIDLDEM